MHEKTVLQCPVCHTPLFQEATRYACDNQHHFDIAGAGYVNLLLPRDTGKGTPGDTIPMLQSRKAFLQRGYYAPFSDRLNAIVATELQAIPPRSEVNILDAGCGEGYYTWRLRDTLVSRLPDIPVYLYGIDVAKRAIQYAAKRGNGIRFAVASSFHLPFLPGSLDCLVCLFAPRKDAEFARVLNTHGALIVAAPGPRHLFQLREFMYAQPEDLGPKGTVTDGFHLIESIPVTFDIHITNTADLLDLVNMTPYSRHIDAPTRERLETINELTTEVDIHIMVYRKTEQ